MNQCDGCRRGLPIVRGIHVDNKYPQGTYARLYMVCTKDMYTKPKEVKDTPHR